MVALTGLFSGFAVKDLAAARAFYRDSLGLTVDDGPMGMLNIVLPQGGVIIVYEKPDHVPATYTMLNLEVADNRRGGRRAGRRRRRAREYGMPYQDEKGIARGKAANMGPDIAWFLDPSGNILSVLSN
ncbi:MAG: VOC family protein [Galbitalea sp.]